MFKFKESYDHMVFGPGKGITITNAIIKLTDMPEGFDLTKRPLKRRTRYEDDTIIFY